MIKISIDDSQFKKVAKKLTKLGENAPKVIAKAINKALVEVKPEAAAAIEGRYNISGVEGQLKVRRASAGGMEGSIEGSGGMISVDEFNPIEGGNREVSVEIIRGNRKVIHAGSRGSGVSGAFMVQGSRVMQRKQAERLPIFPVWTIGVPYMLGSKAVSEPIRDRIGEVTMNEITRTIMEI